MPRFNGQSINDELVISSKNQSASRHSCGENRRVLAHIFACAMWLTRRFHFRSQSATQSKDSGLSHCLLLNSHQRGAKSVKRDRDYTYEREKLPRGEERDPISKQVITFVRVYSHGYTHPFSRPQIALLVAKVKHRNTHKILSIPASDNKKKRFSAQFAAFTAAHFSP